MVVKEFYTTREDGVNLYRTYSDQNLYIRQVETGVEYVEAVDIENAPYTYEETEKVIEKINIEDIIEKEAEMEDVVDESEVAEQ